MPVINMSQLSPVGEFGSEAWGEACAQASRRILEAAKLPSSINWAFTENYTHPPTRLMTGGRTHAGYYIMVSSGKVTAGDGVTEEALALPGFHARLPWALIANQSGRIYGREGQQQRSKDENNLTECVKSFTGLDNPFNLTLDNEGMPTYFVKPVGDWPSEVGKALGEGSEEGNGLHNIAATLQAISPEFDNLPVTSMGVPIFQDMSKQQKLLFLSMCGVRTK